MKLNEGFQLLATAPGGVARLRELILSLAIQGKLAPQDKDDEPANRLLDNISTEKDRLVAESKIKQDKPLAAITENDKPFELPEQWEWVRAQDICTVITDGDHQPPPKASDGVPFLVIGDVRWGSLDVASASRFVPDAYFDRLDWSKKPLAGDILYTTVGSFGIPVQVTEEKRFCFQRHIGLFRPAQTTLQPFLNLVLASDLVFQQASARATGIAQKTVPLSALRDFKIPLPPLAEQARIVAKVDDLMRLCDELEARGRLEAEHHTRLTATLFDALAASESSHALAENWSHVAAHFDLLLDRPEVVDALEQTILQLAVRGRLVAQDLNDEPAGELLGKICAEKDRLVAERKIKREKSLPAISENEKPFELPTGWEWTRLALLGERFDYGTSQKTSDGQGVPVLRMGNIQQGEIVFDSLKFLEDQLGDLPALYLCKSDLLFNRTNSYELVGKTGIFAGESNQFSFASYLIRIRLMSGLVSPQYVNMYMNSVECRRTQIEPQIVQQNGQANFNGTKLQHICVPLPPLAEQARIVVRVEALRRLCADLRARLIARQTCQARFAETLIEQVVSTAPSAAHANDLAAAA